MVQAPWPPLSRLAQWRLCARCHLPSSGRFGSSRPSGGTGELCSLWRGTPLYWSLPCSRTCSGSPVPQCQALSPAASWATVPRAVTSQARPLSLWDIPCFVRSALIWVPPLFPLPFPLLWGPFLLLGSRVANAPAALSSAPGTPHWPSCPLGAPVAWSWAHKHTTNPTPHSGTRQPDAGFQRVGGVWEAMTSWGSAGGISGVRLL